MWFRIELHKDGSVASCEEVEGSFKDSRHVLYIEAESKEQAVRAAAGRYERYLARKRSEVARQRERRWAKGLCCSIGCKNPPRTGKKTCQACADLATERMREYRGRKAQGLTAHNYRDRKPEDLAAADAVRRAKERESKRRRGIGSNWHVYNEKKLSLACRKAFMEALAQYDALSPRAFRAWLEEKAGIAPTERVGAAAE